MVIYDLVASDCSQATVHGGRQLIQLFQQSSTLFGALALNPTLLSWS